jgi:hypothetical protein
MMNDATNPAIRLLFYAGESTVTSYPETFRRLDERRVDAAAGAGPSDSP